MYNCGFGYNTGPTSTYPDLDNTTCIGNGAAVTASNTIRIGNSNITSITGQVNFTASSDGRFKKDVQEDVPGLDFILRLRPLSYHFDINAYNNYIGKGNEDDWKGKYDIEKIKFSGFIAQDVEQAAEAASYDFSGIDKSGDVMGLRYAEFVVPMVKGMQELYTIIQIQQKTIEALNTRIKQLENK
jgi:hypothetical protein